MWYRPGCSHFLDEVNLILLVSIFIPHQPYDPTDDDPIDHAASVALSQINPQRFPLYCLTFYISPPRICFRHPKWRNLPTFDLYCGNRIACRAWNNSCSRSFYTALEVLNLTHQSIQTRCSFHPKACDAHLQHSVMIPVPGTVHLVIPQAPPNLPAIRHRWKIRISNLSPRICATG